jgi:hypothetical protein
VITIAECAATPEGETCVLDAALGDALELTATIADADGDSDFYVDYTWGPPDDPFWWWDEGPTFFFDTQDSGPGEFVAAINAYDGCNRGTLEFLIRVE